jgi:hypothetical protein
VKRLRRSNVPSFLDAGGPAYKRGLAALQSVEPPVLTEEDIWKALARGAKSAQALHEKLERSHLEGYSRAMSLRLD